MDAMCMHVLCLSPIAPPLLSFEQINGAFFHILLLLIPLTHSLSLSLSELLSWFQIYFVGSAEHTSWFPYINSLCSHFSWFSFLSQYKKFNKVRIHNFCRLWLFRFKADYLLTHVFALGYGFKSCSVNFLFLQHFSPLFWQVLSTPCMPVWKNYIFFIFYEYPSQNIDNY